jgi:hypothetical protein
VRRVRLELAYSYKGYAFGECSIKLEREDLDDPDAYPMTVHSGPLGWSEISCGCRWPYWMRDETPTLDATGQDCEQLSDGWVGVDSTRPGDFACFCDRTCNPAYDAPCNGRYRYRMTSGMTFGPTAQITVDWRQAYSGSDPGTGNAGGCRTAGSRPHLLVVLLFVAGAFVPHWLARRRRAAS